MGGKSKKTTVGYWFKPLFHHGLCEGPIDAFLEWRCGDKTAWTGRMTGSGMVGINKPELFGGETDQGGVVGTLELMFGEATQLPNDYLIANLGPQVPGWRGLTTALWRGGKYGAMSAYPQAAAYKVQRIVNNWHGESCWYEEKARISYAPSPAIEVDDWKHVEMSCDGTTVRLFVDGHLKGAFELDFTPNGGAGGQIIIGSWRVEPPNVRNYAGYIDNVRVTKAVRHTDDFTPSTAAPSAANDPYWAANVVVLRFEGPDGGSSLSDDCGNVWTVSGSAEISTTNKISGTASFKVASDGFAYTDAINVGAEFTIDCWVSPAALDGCVVHVNHDFGNHTGYSLEVKSDGTCRVVFGKNNLPDVYVQIDEGDLVSAGGGAMNPAHILYQAETDPGMGREPLVNIHLASFTAAADWYYNNGFGLCADRDPSAESVDEFKERIQKVAACSTSRSLMDGLIYFDIANGVYDLGGLPILTEDDILEWSEQPTTLNNAVNSVSVKYFDVDRKEDVTTPPVQALDLIDAFGLNHQTIEYPEIPASELALRVAKRELLAFTTPLRAFDLKTTRAAYAYRPNQYVRLQAPRRGIADMVCIVASKESGSLKSGAIALKLTQDIYSLPATTLIEVETGTGTPGAAEPQPIAVQRAFEVPYTDLARSLASSDLAGLTADSSFVQAVAVAPAGGKNFAMQTQPAGGQYAPADTGEWCPSALIVEGDDTKLETEFTLASATGIEAVQPGSAALWGTEIVRVVSITPTGAGLTITLARGCVDTVPAPEHDAGERIWFYDSTAAVDPTEYVAGETVNVKLLTNASGGQLSIDAATPMAVALGGRAALPYPPGKVKIAGGDWPATVAGEFVVTWAHRNRAAQADQVIDTSVASVTPPDNQRYGLRFKDAGAVVLVEKTSIGPGTATVNLNYTGAVTMELWTIDNGGTSLQRHVHTFDYTAADPAPAESTIVADDYVPVYDGTIIDGGDLDG